MSNSFRFKRFNVSHDGPAMKVGTDGVLLGAWCTVRDGMRRALDVGTGTGVIALMLAQRSENNAVPLYIDALDLHADVCGQARGNFDASPWAERLNAINVAVQQYAGNDCADTVAEEAPESRSGVPAADFSDTKGAYDLVVSNPPYFEDSLLPPGSHFRATARHTLSLSMNELARAAAELLCDGGIFAVVLPFAQAEEVVRAAAGYGLLLSRRMAVHTTPASQPKRALLEFVKNGEGIIPTDETLIVENAPLDHTDEYKALTREFYLKF